MGGACSTYGNRRGTYRILVRRHYGKKNFEDLRLVGRIILKRFFKNWYGGMDWFDLVQDSVM
jgi:hypothetical protein